MVHLKHVIACLILVVLTASTGAQSGDAENDRARGPARGPGGPGGPQREDIKLVEAHDHDGDGWLNESERAEAREALAELRAERRAEGSNEGRRRGRGPRARERDPAVPGPRLAPDDVETFTDAALYDVETLRTIFLDFENDDWEAELQDFHGTDVEVPATLIVDRETYPGAGVRFRGASSYMRVPAGYKRSFNVSIDLVDRDQRLLGYKTLNLLNCNGDASMMSTVLYSQMADAHLAVPKANFVKVVVNGEYWGVYVNVQQFDKVFTAENFGSSKGTRWKVPGSPRGDGGLLYHGDDLEPYHARYDMKSNDGDKAWKALVELCRVLSETPIDQLVEELDPILDIDEALWFLAFDVALVNSDGYWVRASDYCLFRDKNGRFHVVPHDMNEAFRASGGRGGPGGRGGAGGPPDGRRRGGGGGRGGPGGPRGGGVTLDPLVGLDDERRPLRSRLLAVPELRERYLSYVDQIARHALDWDQLGPQIASHRMLIEDAVEQDTRKLDSYEAFLQATSTETNADEPATGGSLQRFAHGRRAYLLDGKVDGTD